MVVDGVVVAPPSLLTPSCRESRWAARGVALASSGDPLLPGVGVAWEGAPPSGGYTLPPPRLLSIAVDPGPRTDAGGACCCPCIFFFFLGGGDGRPCGCVVVCLGARVAKCARTRGVAQCVCVCVCVCALCVYVCGVVMLHAALTFSLDRTSP